MGNHLRACTGRDRLLLDIGVVRLRPDQDTRVEGTGLVDLDRTDSLLGRMDNPRLVGVVGMGLSIE